nr:reverse transcriptase domain, reverse transcriptase zinc-binding domain protein [Tanacetum cinerariifolium]
KSRLASAKTSILINGSPTSESSLKRGLRQGDPLSPFLFIIVMEGLHMAINDGLAANMFHGVKVDSLGMHISHLFYADDDIILSEWNLNAMENIIWILNIFYIASRLKISIHKSNVYRVGVSSNEVEIMASYTRCEAGFYSFTYLSLPIYSNMRRIVNWQPLIDRFKRWRIFHNPNALWVHVVKAIHSEEAGIDIRDCFIQQRIANGSCFWDWSRPVNAGRTETEFDALISDIASLEPEELVDSNTFIWSLSHDNKFSVNSVRKHIDELSLPSLSPSTR